MNFSPINVVKFQFKKIPQLQSRSLVGLDQGSSLLKVVFLHKEDQNQLKDDSINYIDFHYAFFLNDCSLEEAMKWIKDRCYLPENEDYPIHWTGVGAYKHKDIAEKVFNRKVETVAEELTIVAGIKFCLENIAMSQLKSPSTEFEKPQKLEVKMLEKLRKMMKNKYDNNNEKKEGIFPCMVYICGSDSANYYFDENGLGSIYGNMCQGGKNLMGLAKCILDTNNYNEIVDLANIGERRNVDTVVGEVLNDDPNSPYGKFPMDLPILSFGKCADKNIGKEELYKSDLARSLIALRAHELMLGSWSLCSIYKLSNIYMVGNTFESNIIQKEAEIQLCTYPLGLSLTFLKMGYFGAVGAMFTTDGEKNKYYKTVK